MSSPFIEKSVRMKDAERKTFIKLTLEENKRVLIEVFDESERRIQHGSWDRESFLDHIVALWPDNVAYQFKEDE